MASYQTSDQDLKETIYKYVDTNGRLGKKGIADAFDELNIRNPVYAASQVMTDVLKVGENGHITAASSDDKEIEKIARYARTKLSTSKTSGYGGYGKYKKSWYEMGLFE